MSFMCVDLAIIASRAIYHRTGSNRPEISFNIKINNLLASRNFVLFGGELLNNEKLKSIYFNDV